MTNAKTAGLEGWLSVQASMRPPPRSNGSTAVIEPQPLRPTIVGGFTLEDFTVDLAAGTVTCPEAITVTITLSGTARFGTPFVATCPWIETYDGCAAPPSACLAADRPATRPNTKQLPRLLPLLR